jgi:hypothetical protein
MSISIFDFPPTRSLSHPNQKQKEVADDPTQKNRRREQHRLAKKEKSRFVEM